MTPENVLCSVKDLAISENLKPKEVLELQIYFLTLYCSWLPYRKVGELTNCSRAKVGVTITKLNKKDYALLVLRISNRLKQLI